MARIINYFKNKTGFDETPVIGKLLLSVGTATVLVIGVTVLISLF